MGYPVQVFSSTVNWSTSYSMYTLWWTYKKLLKMAIEIVDFPIKNGWIFPWQNVNVHQRVLQVQDVRHQVLDTSDDMNDPIGWQSHHWHHQLLVPKNLGNPNWAGFRKNIYVMWFHAVLHVWANNCFRPRNSKNTHGLTIPMLAHGMRFKSVEPSQPAPHGSCSLLSMLCISSSLSGNFHEFPRSTDHPPAPKIWNSYL